jgi:hypothetical protein
VSEVTGTGLYLGTTIDRTWWKRYRERGYSARGNGRYRFEGRELVFDRALTSELTRVPLDAVTDVSSATSHAGKWLGGKPIVRVTWSRDGRHLESGFGFADRASADAFAAEIERRRTIS